MGDGDHAWVIVTVYGGGCKLQAWPDIEHFETTSDVAASKWWVSENSSIVPSYNLVAEINVIFSPADILVLYSRAKHVELLIPSYCRINNYIFSSFGLPLVTKMKTKGKQ